MLKKRILASSLASVMALSSVSVVAFADETAGIDTEAVTKAQLKEYVKSLESFVEDELDDYGTTMGENFENAYEAAKVVVDDKDASEADVTAAYQMLKAVQASLKMYTNDELKELVEDYRSIYDTDNIMNEEFSDLIYDADTWTEFASAFDSAEDSLDDTDQRVINDAYADLEAAIKGLKENDVVTKAQFRSAYNDFINLVNEFEEYEDWRRGVATVDANEMTYGDDTTVGAASNATKFKIKDKVLTFAEIKDVVYGASNVLPVSLVEDNDYSDVVTDNDTAVNWITLGGWTGATTVAADAKAAYDKFIANSNSNKTTHVGINKSYAAMKKAVEVFNGWDVDGVKRGSKTSVNTLLDDYHTDLVSELIKAAPTTYDDYVAKIVADLAISASDIETNAGTIKIKDTANVAEGKTIKLDTNTGYIVAVAADYGTGTKTVAAKAGMDLTKYMPINATIVGTTLDAVSVKKQKKTQIKLSTALKAFEAVKTLDENTAITEKDYKAVLDGIIDDSDADTIAATTLDTQGVVTKSSTKSVVYPIVYRAVYYALTDLFPSVNTYTKKDVSNLIKDANQLIDDTGDASKFKGLNGTLDTARKNATAWVAAANATKGYKDGNDVVVTEGYAGYTGMNATRAYEALKDAYDKLNDEFKKFPVSFGDISETIATVAEGLDNGTYGSSAASIQALLESVSYDLSTLEWSDDCEAFDDDRNFIFYNRLNTDGTEGEKAFYANYKALLKAVEESGSTTGVKGDLNGDGTANAKDALAILKANAEGKEFTAAEIAIGDVNGDGAVNAKDALAILKANVNG